MKEYKKEYRKNITDEKKQKVKEYQKQYRENMTDEQTQKMKEYQKNYRDAKKLNKNAPEILS